jgi:hypothetical protein
MPEHIHVTDEKIELYSLGRLSEPERDEFEEHVIVCAECQDRVSAEDAFTVATRGALQKADNGPPNAPAWWVSVTRRRWPALAWAGGLTSASLLLVTFGSRPQPRSWQDVTLLAARGLQEGSRASAANLVRLRIDTRELGAAASWHIEVVDATGNGVWRATVAGAQRVISAELGRLSPGRYWVRISAAAGTHTLREFSLIVE